MSLLRDQDLFMQDSYSQQYFQEDNVIFYPQDYPPEVDQNNIELLDGEIQIIDIVDTEIISRTHVKNPNITIFKEIAKTQYLKKTNKQLGKSKSKKKNEVYMFPGESKNIPKNFTRAFKNFILNHFDSSVLQNSEIKKFLATKPEKACKQTLQNSLKSCQLLKQISQMFFGNLKWGTIFSEENKVELEPYFRFNQIWLGSTN